MKKRLQFTLLLVVAWCLALFSGQSAYASHYQGGQLTYIALGNNQYKVQLAIFRDCSGSTLSSTYTLSYRQTGCAGTGATASMSLVPGSKKIGDPYCATAPDGPSPCAAGKPTNYETAIFETTITLAPAPEWTLSAREGNRPDLGNVLDGFNSYIYYEAKLNNLVNGQVIQNTSPQYEPQNSPIPFVCWRQDTQLSFATTETDGDSLVYSLEEPLDNCGDPMQYANYATNRFIDLTTDPNSPCAAYISSGATGTYSATFPIPSFAISGPACPQIRTATPSFLFNPTLGTMTFNPALFTAGNTTAQQALNKYAVVGKVTEWRRIPKAGGGTVAVKIGSVRREMLVVVIDCGGNQVPGPPSATGGTKTGVQIVNSRDSTFVTAYTCNYTEVRIKFSDPNPNDLLKVSYPELDPPVPTVLNPTYLPQDVATFQLLGNETKTPVGILKIQPDIAFTGRTFRIPVKIEDNGCPIKGITYRTIVLKIEKGNFAKVTPSTSSSLVCAGSVVSLSATPFRPDSVGTAPAQYGYRWAAANGLNPADSTKQTLQVRPTQTTRYKVKILGLSFRPGTCQDTASILIRVQQPIQTVTTAPRTLICRGDSTAITVRSSRVGGNATETFSYQWAAANGLRTADLTKTSIIVKPTVTTRYKVTITGSNNTPCGVDTASVLIRVQQPIQTIVSTNLSPICRGGSSTLTARSSRPSGLASETFTYQWAASNGLNPADQAKATITVNPTVTTRYKLTVTGSNATACGVDTTSIVIRVQQPIQTVVTANQALVCPGSAATITSVSTRPAGLTTETFAYQWAAANGLSTSDQNKPTITVKPTVTTRYKLTVTGSNATACGVDTASVLIRVASPVITAFKADSVAAPGRSITQPPLTFTFTNQSTVTTQNNTSVQYRWTYERIRNSKGQPLQEGETEFSTSATTATRQFTIAGVYTIRLRASVVTRNGNASTTCDPVIAIQNVRVPDSQVPNVFTPNGDGLNDVFVISTEASGSKIKIFNRWGRLVKEDTSYQNNWDGDTQPSGVYYYMLTDANGVTSKGWVELVR